MRYLIAAADPDRRERVRERVAHAGFETVTSYPEGAGPAGREPGGPPAGAVDWSGDGVTLADDAVVVVSLGGDGAILYNARRFGGPTLLPVCTGDSVGSRIDVEADELIRRLRRLEDGVADEDYRIERHRKLGAFVPVGGGADDAGAGGGDDAGTDREGGAHAGGGDAAEPTAWRPLDGGFEALNDVHVHHGSPVRSAKVSLRVTDGAREVYAAERVIGDGVLVATPFGSTGYFRSITGGAVRHGVGVALNNPHRPVDAPTFFSLSPDAAVRVTPLSTTAGVSPVLARDDDGDVRELSPGDPLSIRLTERTVGVVRF